MRILVTGSRDWDNKPRIQSNLRYASRGLRCTLVSGACPTGADRMAEEEAEFLEWDIELHPADWDRWGKAAGPIRNREMVELGADICLAFIKNESKGASMTARLAEEAGIQTVRVIA